MLGCLRGSVSVKRPKWLYHTSPFVDFSGIQKEISLAYVPEANVGDYVIVHAGFALSVLDESEALASLQAFQELAEFEATL